MANICLSPFYAPLKHMAETHTSMPEVKAEIKIYSRMSTKFLCPKHAYVSRVYVWLMVA